MVVMRFNHRQLLVDLDEKGVCSSYTREMEILGLESLISSADINPLMFPSKLIKVKQILKLGSGKSDFSSIRNIAFAVSS
jgi:hypothetical protein